MHRRREPRAHGQIVAGLIITILGFVFLLDNFNVLDSGAVWRFWPVVLIIMGVTRLHEWWQIEHGSGDGQVNS